MNIEREIVKEKLTECHIDELMYEEEKFKRITEVQDNYTKLCIPQPKCMSVPK